jgi:hypothetical protein
VHLDIIKVFFRPPPTDAQVNCLKNNFKIYIKKLQHVSVHSHQHQGASTSNALPDDGVTAPKHVRAVLMSILMYILKLFLRQFTCASVGEKKIDNKKEQVSETGSVSIHNVKR